MITELEVVDPKIIGGRKLTVYDTNIRNERLHKVLEQVQNLLVFCVECQSNNTFSKAVPSDIRRIRKQWDIVKSELEFAAKFNDYPTASHELAFKIYLLDQKEVQRVKNAKIKSVVAEIWGVCHFILSIDCANTAGFLDADDYQEILRRIELCDAVMDRWVGKGADMQDTGISIPSFTEIGQMSPDVDGGDYCVILEPSADKPAAKFPDVADTASTAVK